MEKQLPKKSEERTIGKTRTILYTLARWLGHFSAVKSGDPKKIVKQAGRVGAGKIASRIFRKIGL